MKKIIYPIIFSCFSLTSVQVLADAAKESPFSGNLNIGFSKLSGNVDTESFNYGVKLKHKSSSNQLIFKIDGNESKASEQLIQKDMLTSLMDIYSFNDTSSLYGKVSYLENEFLGYDYLAKLGVGYLHTILDNGNKTLSTRLGYQARNFKEIESGDTDSQNFFQAGFRGSYPLMRNILMRAEVNYEVNFENEYDYESDGNVGLTFTVNEAIDITLDYTVKYDNLPVLGVERTDSTIITNLVYNF